MHEFSICRGLLKQVAAVARQQRTAAVVVRVGPLSGVDPALLARAYPIAAAGTAAAGSRLVVEPAPISVRCQTCGSDSAATVHDLTCAACGDWHTTLISGDELLLVSVELQEEPAHV